MEGIVAESTVEVSSDINDAFDSITCSEEKHCKLGFEEGYKKGIEDGEIEGFHLGYHRGAEIGAELGYYKGVAQALLIKRKLDQTDKINEAFKNVVRLVDQMPNTNTDDFDIISHYNIIKTSFKKACALIKLNLAYPESRKLSF